MLQTLTSQNAGCSHERADALDRQEAARTCDTPKALPKAPREENCFNRAMIIVNAAIILLPAQTAFCTVETPTIANLTPMESFKRFLASPPTIETLVWQKITRLTFGPERPAGMDSRMQKDPGIWFQARWQPGALFLKA